MLLQTLISVVCDLKLKITDSSFFSFCYVSMFYKLCSDSDLIPIFLSLYVQYGVVSCFISDALVVQGAWHS